MSTTPQRPTRQEATREAQERDAAQDIPLSYRPAGILPSFTRDPKYDYKWASIAILGNTDTVRYQRSLAEGWRPVHPSEHPELAYLATIPGAPSDRVESGGLVLCKLPIELARQRDAAVDKAARNQVRSVDEKLRNEFAGDNRVKLINESRTDVGFGTGSL